MKNFVVKAAAAPVAVSFALALAMAASAPASAQATLTNGPMGGQPNSLGKSKPRRPLTVRRSGAPVETAAAPAAAPAVGNPLAAPLGAANAVVGLPFQVLGGIFPAGGPRKGGVTNVRYEGAKAKEAEIDEGFATAVPVDKSGPIFVVENGDPTISPLVIVGSPIQAIGTLAQAPLKVLSAPF